MPEQMPAPNNPEQQMQLEAREQLQRLAAQFSEDLKAVAEQKSLIYQRAMGPESVNDYVSGKSADGGPSPYAEKYHRVSGALYEFETKALNGGFTGDGDSIESEPQPYTAPDGERRSRYAEYKVRDGLIVSEVHDVAIPVQKNNPNLEQELELQAALGVNSEPLTVVDAGMVKTMLHEYRLKLEDLVFAKEAEFDEVLHIDH